MHRYWQRANPLQAADRNSTILHTQNINLFKHTRERAHNTGACVIITRDHNVDFKGDTYPPFTVCRKQRNSSLNSHTALGARTPAAETRSARIRAPWPLSRELQSPPSLCHTSSDAAACCEHSLPKPAPTRRTLSCRSRAAEAECVQHAIPHVRTPTTDPP